MGPARTPSTVTDVSLGLGESAASPGLSAPERAPGTRRDAGRGSRSLGDFLGHLSPLPT